MMDDRKVAILDTLSSILDDAPHLLVVAFLDQLIDDARIDE
jgi:hypothetical protein